MKILPTCTFLFCENFRSKQFLIWLIYFSILLTGCVTPQSDLARIQKDLETQIAKIKEERRALGAQVDDAKTAISESQALIAQQKADMAKMRSDIAPLNQQVKLLREQDLTSLYGKNEVLENRMRDLEKTLRLSPKNTDELTLRMDRLESEVQKKDSNVSKQQNEKVDYAMNGVDSLVTEAKANELLRSIKEFREVLERKGTILENMVSENKRLFTQMSEESSQVKNSQDQYAQRYSQLKEKFDKLELTTQEQFETLEESLATQFTSLKDTLEYFEDLQNKLETMRHEINDLKAGKVRM